MSCTSSPAERFAGACPLVTVIPARPSPFPKGATEISCEAFNGVPAGISKEARIPITCDAAELGKRAISVSLLICAVTRSPARTCAPRVKNRDVISTLTPESCEFCHIKAPPTHEATISNPTANSGIRIPCRFMPPVTEAPRVAIR